ncbi:S-2-hydroxy-acid oxidase [Penicillium chermesinum]|uniref:S-2-hydroxy-acid oxidase n=1 Tax=Penicillium chermesinum TaxID=63820 RepID=A0A9W9PJX2_9EURO|nr:S-2-hydroxy-acid oxidase [Penicillium chermesinum]KAJ5246642.1 S-2-hydroxy-acid oxidase [Penicillium chermesinum]KAJ6144914.1 S-2-hydroxy-acid oxidase [Penicillium chermesinum]
MSQEDPITVDQVEALARKKLPRQVYNYYACGADDETAVARNIADFNSLYILPRILRDVSRIDLSVEVLGRHFSLPIGIAPSAMQKLANPEGELDVARAAASTGVNMTLSSNSTTLLEDVISVRQKGDTAAPFWFQIYLTADLELSVPLIKRAETGYEALVLTVDTPVLGNRINERQQPLVLPTGISLENLPPVREEDKGKPSFNRRLMDARTAKQASEVLQEYGDRTNNAALTWKSAIDFLRRTTTMKIILKGVLAPEDALLAIEYGVDAIAVSNHGGRQLDCVPSTIKALPDIASTVNRRIPVIFDGGIRRGSDVFKALALGADYVLVGRPVLWGLAYKGKEGVENVLNILERELSRTMGLAGAPSVKEINTSYLRHDLEGRLSRL